MNSFSFPVLLGLLFLSFSFSLPAYSTAPPPSPNAGSPKMVHILMRSIEINETNKQVAAQEQELWRVGNDRLRIKQTIDNVPMLTLVQSPDIWKVNLNNLSATHELDTGEFPEVIVPIFSPEPLQQLEAGQERDFFNLGGAKAENIAIGLIGYTQYKLDWQGYQLSLYVRDGQRNPEYVTYEKDGSKGLVAYQTYEYLPLDSSFFRLPQKFNVLDLVPKSDEEKTKKK